jgi:threonyl-tRNA synthetase
MINITLPDGSIRQFENPISSLDVAKSISEGLARNVLAAKVNDEILDANRLISSDSTLQLLTWNDQEGKSTMWHSSAHLMAEALEFYYPGIKLAIGPPVANGFYYDIDFENHSISEKDLEKIEQKMKELAKQKLQFIRQEISKKEALAYFEEKGDPYKLELLSELEDGTITFYTQGNFTDLCRGPHIPDTGFIKAVKLTAIAGAYWRGYEKNKQLTRIYGITFPKQAELEDYLVKVEEAKRRDHRKLGKELELFTFSQKVGQ